MKISNRFALFMMGAMITLVGFSAPVSTEAQVVLRNQTRLSYNQIGQIIARVENSSDRFRRTFDQQMDRNRRDDDDRYVDIVNEFEVSVDELRRDYGRTRNWWEIRESVSNVLQQARDVNVMMTSLSFRRNLETRWAAMRNDINVLADTFDMQGLNGGGWNGGDWNGGNNGGVNGGGRPIAPPSWARGTFYSTSGSDQIQLTIDASGYATVVNNGQSFNGIYTRTGLWVNGDTSTIQRTRDGIRTYNRNERVWTNYSRNSGGGYDPGAGTGSRPPSWAIGTFTNPDNSDFSLTIDATGRVMVYTAGQTFYGTYNGQSNTLSLNNDLSTVSRSGRGIRTYNQRTGESTIYRRQ